MCITAMLLGLSGLCLVGDTADDDRELLRLTAEQHRHRVIIDTVNAIKSSRTEIKRLRSEAARNRHLRSSHGKQIRTLNGQIEVMTDKLEVLLRLLRWAVEPINSLYIGAIGTLRVARRGDTSRTTSIRIIQVMNASSARIKYRQQEAWMNMDTTGLVDGSPALPAGVWKVTGTRKYTTVLGAPRTLFVLDRTEIDPSPIAVTPIDDDEIKRILRATKTANPFKPPPRPARPAKAKKKTKRGAKFGNFSGS